MWLLLFLMFQTLATTEHGEKVLLKDDGTWTLVEEKASELVYIDVITSVSTYTGMYGTQQRNDFNPSKSEIAMDLAKHGVQATLKEAGSIMTLRLEEKSWSILQNGQIIWHAPKPAIQWKNRIKDAAKAIKQLM